MNSVNSASARESMGHLPPSQTTLARKTVASRMTRAARGEADTGLRNGARRAWPGWHYGLFNGRKCREAVMSGGPGMSNGGGLASVSHIVVLMLENRSFDHMLGFLYTAQGNVSPAGLPFAGLTGTESNPDSTGAAVTVSRIEPTTPSAYFMPGADPGEGYMATNDQLFGSETAPARPPHLPPSRAFLTHFAST